MNGVIILDKPAGISSAGAVGRIKWLLPKGIKIGHAGTLDPFATGVLLLLIGRATKLCENLMDLPKQYHATAMLGATTQTDDPESSPTPWPGLNAAAASPTITQINCILSAFSGQIMQQPPVFSALRVNGKRAYALARQGKPPVLSPRLVNIYRLQCLSYEWPILKLLVDCGRGTYIRALARDIGASLQVGGHLVKLCRTQIGPFSLDAAKTLSTLSPASLEDHLIDIEDVSHQLRQAVR